MKRHEKIYIAGHKGLVGSAIRRRLEQLGYENMVYYSSNQLDLLDQKAVDTFFKKEKPDYVFLAAAKVGGIYANSTYPAEFIYKNLVIQSNVIDASHRYGVKKLLFLGSSCIYPKFSPQPMKEQYLLTGQLEPTNEPYAIAKIAGIKMCEAYNRQHNTNFICVMPTNLYGPNDNFDILHSHVVPALIRKFHEAKLQKQKVVEVWGTGSPKREFLFVDDLAEACIYLMNNFDYGDIGPFINIGTGKELSIKELSQKVKDIINFTGDLEFNNQKPDGAPRKLLDVSKMNALGWSAKTSLEEGLTITYHWYLNRLAGGGNTVGER
ncbi:GDP-L-fucose synthase family protein [Paenibacillus silviterrae]|uniref:GDP-L-fucose synthase family protein n=1 Tax=Paenibacillus silviterrae TaxID=3242194 RepID=UPI0025427C03|nr:GDP-L-fucose synthase [Paenibacillus chinjuensis]